MRYSKLALALLGLWLWVAPALAQPVVPVQMRDANLTTTSTQNLISTLNTFSAPRTLTVPGRGALSQYYIQFVDTANAVNGANTLTIQMADGGLINSAASITLTTAGNYVFLVPNSSGMTATIIPQNATGGTPGGSAGQVQFNNAGVFGGFTASGDFTINTTTGAGTLTSVNGTPGSFGSATSCITQTVNAKGLITSITGATCTPAIGSITGLGTGIAAALAINTDSAGAPVLFNGAGGTPSSMVGTNISGTASALNIGGNAATATTATTATNATNSAITNDTTTNATMFPLWVTANTGNLPVKVTSTKLSFNPSTGALSSTSFAGAGTGLTGTAASLNAGTATALATARAIGIGGTTGLTATGVNFDGTAAINPALTGTLVAANGGTGLTSLGTGITTLLGQTYETGSWTPDFTFTTPGDLAKTFAAQAGYYIRIGKLVTVTFNIGTSAFTHTTSAGDLTLTGLPFTAQNNTNDRWRGTMQFSGITKAGYTNYTVGPVANTTTALFIASGSAQTVTTVTAADMPTGGNVLLQGSVTYVSN